MYLKGVGGEGLIHYLFTLVLRDKVWRSPRQAAGRQGSKRSIYILIYNVYNIVPLCSIILNEYYLDFVTKLVTWKYINERSTQYWGVKYFESNYTWYVTNAFNLVNKLSKAVCKLRLIFDNFSLFCDDRSELRMTSITRNW